MAETIFNNTQNHKFTIQNFEGPLNLLLHLISKNKMNIFDISLSELTDEYIKYLNEMTDENIEIASEFIVMAATLLDIKAKKLLPELEEKQDDDDEISEDDIIERIIAYKKYKEVSGLISSMYSEYFGSFIKPFEKIKFKKNYEYTGQDLDVTEISDIYKDILIRNENKINKKASEINKLALYEKITVKDKVNEIVGYLRSNEQMVFNDVFSTDTCENLEVVTAFLGVLELSKLKQVDVMQNYLFSDINVTKTNQAEFKIDLSGIIE